MLRVPRKGQGSGLLETTRSRLAVLQGVRWYQVLVWGSPSRSRVPVARERKVNFKLNINWTCEHSKSTALAS